MSLRDVRGAAILFALEADVNSNRRYGSELY